MKKHAISKHYFQAKELGKYGVGDIRVLGKILDIRDLETKILIYEDRVKEWFLEIAEGLKKNNETGFAILQIALSYIEGNQQYREGKRSDDQSFIFFKRGLKRIFNLKSNNQRLHDFYKEVRCGLFHDGMTRKKVTISCEFPTPLRITKNQIKINPHEFLDNVKKDFNEYINRLKNKRNKKLRKNFEKHFLFTG